MSGLHVSSWINRLSLGAGILAAILFAIVTLDVFVSVLSRCLFRNPIGWTEESTRFLLVWGVMLGMAYTLQEKGHIRVMTFFNRFPPRGKKYLEILMNLIGLMVLAVFVVKSYQFTLFTKNIGELSQDILAYPLWWAELALPVGGGLFILQYLVKTWADIRGEKISKRTK
jgi:C4-dicarboxylate transporter DctQ subunit